MKISSKQSCTVSQAVRMVRARRIEKQFWRVERTAGNHKRAGANPVMGRCLTVAIDHRNRFLLVRIPFQLQGVRLRNKSEFGVIDKLGEQFAIAVEGGATA